MKQYLISEEELDDLLFAVNVNDKNRMSDKYDLREWIKDIKSKKPVEILAEGEVLIDDEDGEVWVGTPDLTGTWLGGEMRSREGKKGKLIWISN